MAGTGLAGYSGDGGPATSAALRSPTDVAVDASGNMYIADFNNNRIRMVTKSTGVITTVAGTGPQGFTGDGGLATSATLRNPFGVVVDASGNMYIADTYNHCIRMVTKSTGVITTVAGTGSYGYSGDGGLASSATLYYPEGVTVDTSGNVYIADSFNHRIRIFSLSAAAPTPSSISTSSPTAATLSGGLTSTSRTTCESYFNLDIIQSILILKS